MPVFAEIIAPRIGIIFRRGFVEHQRLEIDAAAIRRVLAAARMRRASGLVAIAPIHEGLRIGEGGRLVERKADIGIDRFVGDAVIALEAGIGKQSPDRIISEVGRGLFRPRRRGEGGWRRRVGIAAREIERVQEILRDAIGLRAGNPARARAAVETGNRDHIGHAVFLERIAQIIFEHEAADIRKGLSQGRAPASRPPCSPPEDRRAAWRPRFRPAPARIRRCRTSSGMSPDLTEKTASYPAGPDRKNPVA